MRALQWDEGSRALQWSPPSRRPGVTKAAHSTTRRRGEPRGEQCASAPCVAVCELEPMCVRGYSRVVASGGVWGGGSRAAHARIYIVAWLAATRNPAPLFSRVAWGCGGGGGCMWSARAHMCAAWQQAGTDKGHQLWRLDALRRTHATATGLSRRSSADVAPLMHLCEHTGSAPGDAGASASVGLGEQGQRRRASGHEVDEEARPAARSPRWSPRTWPQHAGLRAHIQLLVGERVTSVIFTDLADRGVMCCSVDDAALYV